MSPSSTLTKAIEAKVIAGAAGSGLGAALGTFVLWLLGVLVWHAPSAATAAEAAIAAVPSPVSALVLTVLAIVGTAVAGFLAPHTSRIPGAHSADTASPDSRSPADLTGPPDLPPPLTTADLLNVPPATTTG